MKKDSLHMESKIEESLRSLDNMSGTKAPDFFYTRLQARMEAEILEKPTRFFWIGNLKMSMAVLVLVFVMNVLSVLMINFSSGSAQPDGFNTLSEEYFSPTDNYNYLSEQE